MSVTIRWTLLAGALVLPVRAPALGDGLEQRVRTLFASAPGPSPTYGVEVYDLTDGERVFGHRSLAPMIPASNQKLLVMAAAVDLLGPYFEFRTVLGVRGDDLVIVGDGDPAIGDPRLCKQRGFEITDVFERWADALKRAGYAQIAGDLILDESIFDDRPTHPSWEPRDLLKWYGAPVGALNLATNCIEITAWPSKQLGDPVIWSVNPPLTHLDLVNRARTAPKGTPIIARDPDGSGFILSGQCGSRATLAPAPVSDPGMFFADACLTVFRRAGVQIRGDIVRRRVRQADGVLPVDVEVVAIHRTPIGDVLARVGKNSQNMFAECLMKRMGYEHAEKSGAKRPVGSWKSGAAAVEAFLDRHEIERAGLIVDDASGLSRGNRVTAAMLTNVLRVMHEHPHGDLFRRNLAVAGEEGSLRRRMRDLGTRVIGKTGTLRGVKALSGYVDGPADRTYAFAIIFNDFKGGSAPYKRLQDDLCRLLASASEAASP